MPEILEQCRRVRAGVLECKTVAENPGGILEPIKPLYRLEYCRRLFGTVTDAKILKIFGAV